MSNETNTQFAIGNIWFPGLSYNTYLAKPEESDKHQLGIVLDTSVENAVLLNKLEDGKHVYRFGIKFNFKAVNPMEDKNLLIFETVGLMSGDIIMDDEHDIDLLKNFIKVNQNMIAYPYIRTTVDQMITKAGLPPLSMLIFY
ncbi:MAG: protein-export chaperone SecB [Calditerrivibrio sp.]|nr:protein-export chaperone SecB [Calditerrivibrio sp.]